MKRVFALALILGLGALVSSTAVAIGDDLPAKWIDQPGQADPDDPNPNQVAVTGRTPEQATYFIADWVAENYAKAESAAFDEPPVPGDVRSLEEIYRARAAQGQRVLDQLCLQLAADGVVPEPCR